jgi:hypothetical protein
MPRVLGGRELPGSVIIECCYTAHVHTISKTRDTGDQFGYELRHRSIGAACRGRSLLLRVGLALVLELQPRTGDNGMLSCPTRAVGSTPGCTRSHNSLVATLRRQHTDSVAARWCSWQTTQIRWWNTDAPKSSVATTSTFCDLKEIRYEWHTAPYS